MEMERACKPGVGATLHKQILFRLASEQSVNLGTRTPGQHAARPMPPAPPTAHAQYAAPCPQPGDHNSQASPMIFSACPASGHSLLYRNPDSMVSISAPLSLQASRIGVFLPSILLLHHHHHTHTQCRGSSPSQTCLPQLSWVSCTDHLILGAVRLSFQTYPV